jgi:hypothetical protein
MRSLPAFYLACALLLARALPLPFGMGVLAAPRVLAAEPVRISITIKDRKVDAGQNTIRVTQGVALELSFTSDEAAELHLHGYDRTIEVVPGAAAVLPLDTRIAGRFPIEAHRFGGPAPPGRRKQSPVVLFYLEVHPR